MHGGSGGGGESSGPGQPMMQAQAALSLALLWGLYQLSEGARGNAQEITFADFRRELLESGEVDRIVIINKAKAKVIMRDSVRGESVSYHFSLGNVSGFERKLEQAQEELSISPREYLPVTYESETSWSSEAFKLAPTLLLIGFWIFMMRGAASSMGGGGGGGGAMGRMFSVGKSKPTIIAKEKKTGVLFKDVAGLAEAKVEVMEVVDFLKNPEKYKDLGAKIPKGALLVGPPGTGKTLLAKATAGEASVPFLSVSGSDFVEMFVGVGPSRVRDLFAQAKTMAPCIIFIDEIDAIGRSRGKGGGMGGNDERENTLNQLLVEMDGFVETGNIVVMAGTNRPDVLDSALLRPGRFDRQIQVDPPDVKGRVEILKVYLPKVKYEEGLELDEVAQRLAALTPGFTGAELANVVNEAALIAARHEKESIDFDDFSGAIDRIIGGLEKKSKVLSLEEKTLVAHHEAGHAVTGWFLKHAAPLLKVSIVPRGSAALGYAQYLPKEQKLHTKEQMIDTMCMMLGGRIAEKIFFDKVSTGAQDDLQKVTRLAYSIVTLYGMNDAIGNRSYPSNNQDGSIQHSRPYSEQTAELVDEEVRAIANAAYERTRVLLTEKKELMADLAKLLLEKEVIHKSDVEAILGKRPFDPGMLGNGHNPMSSGDRASALDVQPAMIVQDPAPPGAL
jgi:AFG3 family protein